MTISLIMVWTRFLQPAIMFAIKLKWLEGFFLSRLCDIVLLYLILDALYAAVRCYCSALLCAAAVVHTLLLCAAVRCCCALLCAAMRCCCSALLYVRCCALCLWRSCWSCQTPHCGHQQYGTGISVNSGDSRYRT